jgi:membrane-bound lytic murein transglycosylase D
MNVKVGISVFCAAMGSLSLSASNDTLKVPAPEVFVISPDDPVLVAIDDMLASKFFNFYCFSTDTALLNIHCFETGEIPRLSPEVLSQKLELLNRETPFNLVYNAEVDAFIRLYAERKRELTARALGLAQLYFPLFDEMFDKYGIPYEMRYLAVIESALNPKAKSKAGATGLWQFMYHTGKMYGLEVNSYVDERMDPVKSTEAACKYLRHLYEMYDDWDLAMAAYNCGPGNVNKAIRRAGGKRGFWELRPFLPKETSSYVPAFIAVNYVMNHASDHNIYPRVPNRTYFELDTLHVTRKLTFAQLSMVTGLTTDEIDQLNPSYKLGVIPENGKKNIVILPTAKAGEFLANLETLPEPPVVNHNTLPALKVDNTSSVAVSDDKVIHKVKSGDTLNKIAQRHGVSVTDIQKWNKLKNTTIYPGQSLTIFPKKLRTGQVSPAKSPVVLPYNKPYEGRG